MKSFLHLALAAGALLLVGAACAPTPAATATFASSGLTGGQPTGSGTSGNSSGVFVPAEFTSPQSQSYSAGGYSTGQGEGIWVTGSGTVKIKPDLALLTLGVEAQETTVAEARDKAADALDAIIVQLHDLGITDDDIETQHFSIQPIIRYDRVFRDGREYSEQRIEGYRVTNTIVVTIREIERAGEVIDTTVTAGGDLTRIQGIRFTVEDQSAAHTLARELATKDAIAKARQFADLLEIELGKPVFVTQVSGGGPIVKDLAERVFAMDAEVGSAAPTPIQSSSIEVNAQVQVVFAIP